MIKWVRGEKCISSKLIKTNLDVEEFVGGSDSWAVDGVWSGIGQESRGALSVEDQSTCRYEKKKMTYDNNMDNIFICLSIDLAD